MTGWRQKCGMVGIGFGLFCAAAHADPTLPPHKPGFWVTSMVMHMNMAGIPPDTDNTPTIMAMCNTAALDAKSWQAMLGGMPGCQNNVTQSGNVYTFTATCPNPAGSGQMHINGTITLDSDTEIHVVSSGNSPTMTDDISSDSKWQGACPAGVAPGDFGHMENGSFQKQGNLLTTGTGQ